jgi:hypothetical protein
MSGICEPFDKAVLEEFYRLGFRKKVNQSLTVLRFDLDSLIAGYPDTMRRGLIEAQPIQPTRPSAAFGIGAGQSPRRFRQTFTQALAPSRPAATAVLP